MGKDVSHKSQVISRKREMGRITTKILAMVFLLVVTGTAAGFRAVHEVPARYPTIQAAIDAAADGDIVLVADGIYTGEGNWDIDFRRKAITVRSENGYKKCVIDCNDHRGFFIDLADSSILDGLTITNGYAVNGGAIFCFHSNLTVKNCYISGNRASTEGGGIFCIEGSNIKISNCIITGNYAPKGGGIYCKGGRKTTHCTITNCTIVDNSEYRYSTTYGGGIYIHKWITSVISNCIIWDNHALYSAGLYIAEPNSAMVTYSNIQDGWPGEGNIKKDPRFVDDTDFHLLPDSPCIDTGTNILSCGLPDTDIEGSGRLWDGNNDGSSIVDMGAYEFRKLTRPVFSYEPKDFRFRYHTDGGTVEPQSMWIKNSGTATISWQIINNCSWLRVEPMGGESADETNEIILSVDAAGMSTGLYHCEFNISSPNIPDGNITVPVTLSVGTTLRVPSQYSTIQSAIDDANDYDLVLISDGTYTGEGNYDINFKTKALTIRGENGPKKCIIDCNGTGGYGFYFESYETDDSILEDLTITNGSSGIVCGCGWLSIINCHITSNKNYGIYSNGGALTIGNCDINHNKGNGIYSVEGYYLIIDKCKISKNSANNGGGVSIGSGKLIITDSTITDNFANNSGGGISSRGYIGPNGTIKNSIIANNKAAIKGGGLCFDVSRNLKIANCTITNNIAGETGGGLYFGSNSYIAKITNSIIWGNDANSFPEMKGGMVSLNYSNIEGGWEGVGNIDAEPYFVDGNNADPNLRNYRLRPGSPCVNAGDPYYFAMAGETDLGGLLRIIGGRVDMGAYEYMESPADLNDDGIVNMVDFAIFAKAWHTTDGDGDYNSDCDMDGGGSIGYEDMAIFAKDWLW